MQMMLFFWLLHPIACGVCCVVSVQRHLWSLSSLAFHGPGCCAHRRVFFFSLCGHAKHVADVSDRGRGVHSVSTWKQNIYIFFKYEYMSNSLQDPSGRDPANYCAVLVHNAEMVSSVAPKEHVRLRRYTLILVYYCSTSIVIRTKCHDP